MAGGSVAAVRERDELRRPAGLAGRRIYLAVALGFDQIGTPLRQGLERLRAQVMHDVSGADDHDLAARANRWDADLFLAVRAGDSTDVGGRVVRDRHLPLRARLPRRAHDRRARSSAVGGRDRDRRRSGAPTRSCARRAWPRSCARSPATTPATSRGRSPHSAEIGAAMTDGARRAFEEARISDPAAG